MKIRNRFADGRFITVHDQLLLDLYKLNLGYPLDSITIKTINGEKYLANAFYKRAGNGYQIELLTKIPSQVQEEQLDVERLFENKPDESAIYYDYMKERLIFSSEEVLIADILFSDFLNKSSNIRRISFKEIEAYRCKASSYANIVLNDKTAEKYKEILKSLCSKLILLQTNSTFRKERYGVNDKDIFQPFLEISNVTEISKNNWQFDYSFGFYGEIIKRSRRYSNILPDVFYQCSLKQAAKHRMAIYIAQGVFCAKYHPNRKYLMPMINEYCEWCYGDYNYTTRQFNNIYSYSNEILEVLKDCNEVSQYGIGTHISRHKGSRAKYNKSVTSKIGYVLILAATHKDEQLIT